MPMCCTFWRRACRREKENRMKWFVGSILLNCVALVTGIMVWALVILATGIKNGTVWTSWPGLLGLAGWVYVYTRIPGYYLYLRHN